MRGYITLKRIIEALERAEEIKRTLPYCEGMRELGCCHCREGELCQTALAIYLEISKEAIRQFLNRLEFVFQDDVPIRIRTLTEIRQSYPRKFISLKKEKISLLVKK
ncbi:hypothetical protein [Archaeoglobus profundus]|uniref:Uncharacterized protein n=1 Tax=Archaeoglobus profundus (strain DSM 5631 / JCM 9629 / NBRC 100127 / Av18) TaxID=572546 RepID=D2RHX7_ARCPA|nr:hypothetical protein [Archaeoglobus profundus]ADB57902.1 hypothetical protein Arcpr_0839 [Archaeoglobus profundus DSM 5631]